MVLLWESYNTTITQRTSSFLGFGKLLKIEPTNLHVIRILETTRLRRLQLSVNLNISYKNERIDGWLLQ